MSDTILGGDFTVTYLSESRQKRVEWTGAATGTRSINELYSALQDLLDDLNQMDDGVPMSAQTPTEYTIGIIDPGDKDPWFIDRSTVEHLTGGALKTASWARVETSNVGIVKIGYTQTVALVAGDIGKKVVMTIDGDSGTLLDFNATSLEMWIRPDDDLAANSFDDSPTANGAWTVTGGTGTGNQAGGTSLTGESLWAGIFTIGSQAANSHFYVIQGGSLLTAYKATTDWWGDGSIDILVNVKEVDVEADAGVVTVFARRYTALYDNFETDLTAGGRNPIPLATATDLNNPTGYRQFTGSAGTGTFVVGSIIEVAASDKQGVLTKVAGTTAAPILDYYLIGDPLTDFANTDAVVQIPAGPTCTAGTPANVGPAVLAGTTIVHAADETHDIDEDGTTENYSVVVDCSLELLADVYEWTKYILRRGGTSTGDTDGLEAQQYIGSDVKVVYTTLSGTIAEGTVVTQVNTLATGTVVAHNTTDKILILRNSRGTFNSTDQIDEGANNVTGPTSSVITPNKSSPYGTFAGGVWFTAPGVVLINVPAADANNFQLTDDDGNIVKAPTKVTATVANTRALDSVSLFRLTAAGGVINKTEHAATVQAAGATTLVVGAAIPADTPPAGAVRLVDNSAATEYRMRYASFTASTFTLASTAGLVADAGTNATTIVDAAGSFNANAKVGDLIRNVTAGVIGYVVTVDSDTQLTTTTMTGQTTADTYDLNTLPVATVATDDAYVPLIDAQEDTGTDGTPGSEAATFTFVASIPVRARVRRGKVILPFEGDGTVTNIGFTISAIRTPDSIAV